MYNLYFLSKNRFAKPSTIVHLFQEKLFSNLPEVCPIGVVALWGDCTFIPVDPNHSSRFVLCMYVAIVEDFSL